jgi:VanZ family protein
MEFILRNKRLFAILFWLWVALIFYFTLTPYNPDLKVEVNEQSFRLDYFFHFLVYLGLSVLYLFWKADSLFHIRKKYLVYFLITALLLSGLSEYAQTFIPGRTFNPVDFYANAAGILAGVAAPKIFFGKKPISK